MTALEAAEVDCFQCSQFACNAGSRQMDVLVSHG